jgi:hypothetical protein
LSGFRGDNLLGGVFCEDPLAVPVLFDLLLLPNDIRRRLTWTAGKNLESLGDLDSGDPTFLGLGIFSLISPLNMNESNSNNVADVLAIVRKRFDFKHQCNV